MKDKKVYCTNMDDDDPIIEKFLKEYLNEKEDGVKVEKDDSLIVNFDITYGDGESENYTCNNESEVFGDRKLEKKQYEVKDDLYYSESEKGYDIESEIGKWTNCVDEWCECSNKDKEKEYNSCEEIEKNYIDKIEKDEIKENCKCKGKIAVYSILSLNESTTLKGVTINLYRINGVKSELVCSKETNENGLALFNDVDEGNYRIIQIIDKRYFERPTYLTWNEVNICDANKEYVLYVLNTLKNYRKN